METVCQTILWCSPENESRRRYAFPPFRTITGFLFYKVSDTNYLWFLPIRNILMRRPWEVLVAQFTNSYAQYLRNEVQMGNLMVQLKMSLPVHNLWACSRRSSHHQNQRMRPTLKMSSINCNRPTPHPVSLAREGVRGLMMSSRTLYWRWHQLQSWRQQQ